MMNPSEHIANNYVELQERFNIRRIGIFGSFVRGEATETSDVDVLVEFEEIVDLFTFLELKDYLEQLLGRKVDLVTEKALKERIKTQVLGEVQYI